MNRLGELANNPIDIQWDEGSLDRKRHLHQEMQALDEVVNTARIRELQRAATLLNEEGHTQLAESLREWTKRLNKALAMEEVPSEVWIG